MFRTAVNVQLLTVNAVNASFSIHTFFFSSGVELGFSFSQSSGCRETSENYSNSNPCFLNVLVCVVYDLQFTGQCHTLASLKREMYTLKFIKMTGIPFIHDGKCNI